MVSYIVTGTFETALKIGGIGLFTKMIMYFIHELIWSKRKKKGLTVKRSFFKTLTWRMIGSLDTFIISLFIVENAVTAATIGGIGFFTKSTLYFLHERAWSKIKWLKTSPPLLKEHEIELIDDFKIDIKSIITKNKEKDTLNYWFSEVEFDSIRFTLKSKEKKESYTVKYKEKEKDSLVIVPSVNSTLDLNDKFKLLSNIPIDTINNEYIQLLNKDSISIPFKTKIDKNNFDIIFDFELLPNDEYNLFILPNAITDFFKSTTDTLSYNFSTKSRADYGTIRARIENVVNFPIIVQLTNDKEEVIQENILKSYEDPCVFKNIIPSKYFIRIIEDKNENNKWDTGDFLNKIKPEKTFHNKEEIIVRANWILEEKINLIN